MRKLIIAVLVLISLESFAQPTNYTWYKQRIRQYSLMLDSMLYIPRYNGTPSGVRANENSAIDGAIAVDTANGRQYFYYNGSWRRLANYSELGVDSIWRVAGKDSIFWSKAGNTYKIKDSTGGGGSSGGGIGSFQDSVANVLDYGAVGDGVTDDGIAIKAAIATGRTVYFPKGNYKTDSTLMPVVDKQVFYGDGSSSQLYTTQTTRAIIKIPLGIDSCTVQNLSFLGTSTSGSLPGFTNSSYQMGVWVNSIANKVRGCTFTKLVRGVYLFDGAVTPMENNIVSDCYFKGCYAGIENDYGSDYGLYVDNQMYGCYAAIIEGGAGNQYYGNTVATYGYYGYYSRGGNLHSSMVNMSFNHNTSGMTITQGSLGLTITNSNFWFSTIDLGTTDTVKNLAFVNCVVAGTTINATRVTQSSMVGGYWYHGNTLTGSGLSYEQIGKNTYSAGLPRYLMDTLSSATDTTGYTLPLFNTTGKYLRYFPLSSLGTGGGGSGITVGTTTISSGTNKRFAYNGSGVYGESAMLTQETNKIMVSAPSGSTTTPFYVNDSEDNTGYSAEFAKAGVLKLGIGTGGNVDMVDIGSVSTPSSGYGRLYVRTDTLRFKNDAGTEFTLGIAGSGGPSNITVGTTTITSGTGGRVGFNDGSVYGEDAGLSYDKSTDILSIGVAANVPTIYGGTGTTSDLNLKTTTGVGTTGADMHFLVGNNGGTEAMSILNSGAIGFDNTAPSGKFHFVIPSGSEATTAWTTDNFVVGASGTTGAGIGITRNGSSITMQALAPNTAWQDLKIKSGTGYWYGGGTNLAFHIGTTGNMGIGTTVTTDRMNINGSVSMISGRHKTAQGADVASAAGAITLGSDGNVFEITGTSAITAIVNTSWQNGATITLLFTSTATLTDGTANSGTSIGFELAGNANFTASADDVITLVLSEIGGTQRWREVSRSVN